MRSYILRERERERERERVRHRERQRETETERLRQTDRQTDREIVSLVERCHASGNAHNTTAAALSGLVDSNCRLHVQ